jgi:transposase
MKNSQEILEKVLLPLNSAWEVVDVAVDEAASTVEVGLRYSLPYVENGGMRYPIYDHRHLRKWRHLDLWQHKTYLCAKLPRYRDAAGHVHTVEVPWADADRRLTCLLEKKR